MGAVSIDIAANGRRLESAFPLHTVEGVESFLEKLVSLEELKYTAGDYDVTIWLVDFYEALYEAKLSQAEKKIVYFLYFEGYRQKDLTEMFGYHKNTVNTLKKRAILKLAKYYDEIRQLEVNF
ncbi:sigma factor-like helix-turn-helix DNA-binding protein [Bacillus wiedmannii]|uniref:sigma factor-like helix-turn-helix DNA-binding protein n=1 Tax=Bacillus wiedmannii TaxID=1890302 RepID=UPI000BF0EF4E|nr:sigma factor-like helix-turn-helix DNA-binding protein [Bacillus wiedmannii]PEM08531.1 hypothetical protein CN610_19970 [Bacillus wiedmannii]